MTSATKIAEIRVSKLAANIIGTLLTILFCVTCVLIAHALPYHKAFAEGHALLLLGCLVLLPPVHWNSESFCFACISD
jgi:hypothetical protein